MEQTLTVRKRFILNWMALPISIIAHVRVKCIGSVAVCVCVCMCVHRMEAIERRIYVERTENDVFKK